MECIGFDLSPFAEPKRRACAELTEILLDSGRISEIAAWNAPAPQAVLVAQSEGVAFAMIPGLPGYLPWILGDEAEEMSPGLGFLPRQKLELASQDPSSQGLLQHTQALTNQLRGKFGDALQKNGQSPYRAAQLSTDPGPKSEGEQGKTLTDAISEKAPEIAMNMAANVLAAGLNGGSLLNPAALLNGLSGGVLSAAMQFGLEKLLGKPEPGDSTGKWAMVMAGPHLLKLIFSTGNVSKLFGGPGPYDDAALRVGDPDKAGNKITTGMASVWIEGKGKLAARLGDAVEADGKAVQKGVMQVLIGGKPAARADAKHPGYGSWSSAGQFLTGASQTFIGGAPTFDPKDPSTYPPIPGELAEQGKKMPGGNPPKYGAHDPSMPKPDTPGYYFDTNLGEWRIWDPNGSGGWSLTPIEYSNISDWGVFKTPFEADSTSDLERRGNWYLLGGLIDLGSPWFPGAGSAQAWFIPDSIFGMDFKPYYNNHDWSFSPTSPNLDTWHGWWDQIVGVEWESYRIGAASHGFNPLGQLFQLAYSLATTIVGFLEWSDMREGIPSGIPGH